MAQRFLSAKLLPLLAVALAVVAGAQTAPRELLNSERIAAEFGSYGVAVLEQDSALRVSNLFSGTGDEGVCRTFAVVRYAERMDPTLGAEHAAVVAGGSLGAVFAAAGFDVRKTHLWYGERAAPPKLASLMRVAPGTPLAVHVYALDVAKGGRSLEYAALVEIHHPDYLTRNDLPAIYGPADAAGRSELVEALLATASEKAGGGN